METHSERLSGDHSFQIRAFLQEGSDLVFVSTASKRISITAGILVILLASCGDSSDSTNSLENADNINGLSNTSLQNTEEESASNSAVSSGDGEGGSGENSVLAGRFYDSKVEGLAYRTETRDGYTDTEGTFQYLEGENIVFFIGDPFVADQAWELGNTLASEMITPLELANAENIESHVINLLRFLQTLDMDDNVDNGIQLPSPTEYLPDGSADVKFSGSLNAFQNNAAVLDFISRTKSLDSLVDEKRAIEHFQKTLNTLLPAPTGSWKLLGEGEPDGLQATIKFIDQSRYATTVHLGDINVRILASYDRLGLELEKELLEIQISTNQQQLRASVDDDNWGEVYGVLNDLLTEPMRIATGLDTRLSLLPGRLVLESEDREVQLNYVQVASADPVVDNLQLESLDVELIQPGQQLQLEATIFAEDNSVLFDVPLSWTSSNEAVVIVSNSGLITVNGNGTAIITVSTANKSTSITVDVQIATDTPVETETETVNETDTVTDETSCKPPQSPSDQLVNTGINEITVEQQHYNDNPDAVVQENSSTITQSDNSETVCKDEY